MKNSIITLLGLFILLSGCGGNNNNREMDVFRLNRYDNITSLDPAFARNQPNNWACNLMYNSLVKLNDSLEVVPDAAKFWRIDSAGLRYTFTLRHDLYFHSSSLFGSDSTRRVTAHDFEYSFNRLTDSEVGGSGAWVLNAVASFQALNDSVFQIHLKKNFPPFLGLLSTKYCSVVPPEAFQDGYDFANHPIGTGPFQFKFWEKNVKLVLRKNPNYFERDAKGEALPYLEAVSISFLPEKYSEFLGLMQGELDMLVDLDASYKDELLLPSGEVNPKFSDELVMNKVPYLSTLYLCFYLDSGELIPEPIRKAIAHALDKRKLVKYLRNDVGTAANGGFIPKGLPGFGEGLSQDFNINKAKELLADYQTKQGELPNITLTTTAEYTDIAEFVQSQTSKVGLNIAVDVVPGPTLKEGKANGKYPFFRANWGADYPDAENFLSLFYSKNFAPNGPNYSHYSNSLFDQWYDQASSTNDFSQRKQLYLQMDSLVMKSVPVIPIFYDETVYFHRKNIKGLHFSPVKLLDLTRVRKE